MSLTITGNVIEDENLGLTSLASDTDASDPDDNVTLSTFQSSITTASSLGAELKTLGIYPDTTTNGPNGTTQAIGISEDAIVSTTDQNLQFTTSSGGALNGVDTGFKAIDGSEIFLYSDPSNPDIVLGRELNSTGTVAFALLLQPTSGGATIWVVQYEALTNTKPALGEDANTLDLHNLVYVSGSSSSTQSFNIGTKQPGQNYWLPFTSSDGKSTVLVTGLDSSTANPDTVNTSSVGDGSDSQAVTPGGALRFDFVSTFSGGSTKDKTFLTDGTLKSLAYIEGTGASFDISQVTPTGKSVNVKIIAQNESSTTFGSTQTSISTSTVALGDIQVFSGTTLIADSARTTGNNGITFGGTTSAPDGTVNGLTAGEKIQFTSLNGAQFDQFVVENIMPPGNTPGFDILNVTEIQTLTNTDHTEVGSHIIFEDSVPTAADNPQTAIVDEDALVSAASEAGSYNATATGSVTGLFNAGADTPLTYKMTGTSGLPTLTSDGAAVGYTLSADGLTLTAATATKTVFTLTLNATTGAYSFTLSAPIDQDNTAPTTTFGTENAFGFNVGSLIQATDADGSSVAANANGLTLTIIDDQPTAADNPQTAIVDEDALVSAASEAGSYNATATGSVTGLFNAGADTPLTYKMTGTSGLPTLTSDGAAVGYTLSADGLTLTAATATKTVFTLTLNATTGAYSFTLSAPIDQDNTAPTTTFGAENAFGFNVGSLIQATDADGSSVAANANGLNLTIIDDQPTAADNPQTAIVDEDALVSAASEAGSYNATATGSVTGLFNAGADTPLTYKMTGTSGLPTLTSDGAAVGYTLSADGLTLTAATATKTVFTLTLNATTGAYSFTLSAPIDQDNTAPTTTFGTENAFGFNVGSLIQATDADGSSVAANANGLTLTIIDDQPTAADNPQTAIVDEDALVSAASEAGSYNATATGSVTGLFNAGADTPLTYKMTGTSGLPTLTSDGAAVGYTLSADGLTLTAATATKTVFTLTLNATTGAYSFTLSAPIDQDNTAPTTTFGAENAFGFNVGSLIQATDADGSSVAANANGLNLTIIDDQPTFIANSSSSGSVDEDALSTNKLPDATGTSADANGSVSSLFTTGADKPLSFTLSSITTSLASQNLKSNGTALFYSVSSDHTTLTATRGSGGPTVFTLTLDTSGNWTFALSAPIDQAPGTNDSSQTSIDFSALIQATDADGNTATAPANAWTVAVIDDVPVNFNPEAIVSGDNVKDAAGSSFTGNLVNTDSADGTVDPNSLLTIEQHAGGDGFGALTFTGTDGAKLTGQLGGGSTVNLEANGSDIYLFGFGTGTLTATTDSTGAGLPGGAGGSAIAADEVFTITLNPDAGTYTYNMLQAISNGSNFTFSDFADVPAGDYAWFSLPFNPTTKEPVSPGKSVVFTGLKPGTDTVNPSSIGVGTDKQAVAPGTGIRLDFVDNVHSITSTTALKSLSTLSFLDHYEVNNSGFTLSQVNPTGKTVDIRLDAFNVPTSATTLQTTDTNQQQITEVKIVTEDSQGNITGTLADFTADGSKTFTSGGVSQTVTADFAPTAGSVDSNGVDLTGLKLAPGEFILVSTATGFDRLLATNIGTAYNNKNSFDMGAVSVSTFNVGQPVNMAFNLALQDYDAFNSGLNSNLTEAGTGTLNINLTAPTQV